MIIQRITSIPIAAQIRRCHNEHIIGVHGTYSDYSSYADDTTTTAHNTTSSSTPTDTLRWRWIGSLDADVLLLTFSMLAINLILLSWLSRELNRYWHLRYPLLTRIVAIDWNEVGRKFLIALQPIDTDIYTIEDVMHVLIQLACASYCGRVLAERFELLTPHSQPLDFGTCEGLALHAALGAATWGFWSAVSACVFALQDHYAEWRWTAAAVVYCPEVHPRLQPERPWPDTARGWRMLVTLAVAARVQAVREAALRLSDRVRGLF